MTVKELWFQKMCLLKQNIFLEDNYVVPDIWSWSLAYAIAFKSQ